MVFNECDHDRSGEVEYREFVRYALRDGLKRSGARVMDLLRKWDVDNSSSVDRKEFRRAIRGIGFDAPMDDIDALFREMDSDGSGEIGFKELNAALRVGASVALAEELQVGAAGEIELERTQRHELRAGEEIAAKRGDAWGGEEHDQAWRDTLRSS